MKAVSFSILTFISSFGDILFLTGVPLFLFKDSGGSYIDTKYISFFITISILVAKRIIVTVNSKSPLKVVGFGELALGIVEILMLISYSFYPSKWILIIGTVPLALIYNI